jgi:hypothetical protein
MPVLHPPDRWVVRASGRLARLARRPGANKQRTRVTRQWLASAVHRYASCFKARLAAGGPSTSSSSSQLGGRGGAGGGSPRTRQRAMAE